MTNLSESINGGATPATPNEAPGGLWRFLAAVGLPIALIGTLLASCGDAKVNALLDDINTQAANLGLRNTTTSQCHSLLVGGCVLTGNLRVHGRDIYIVVGEKDFGTIAYKSGAPFGGWLVDGEVADGVLATLTAYNAKLTADGGRNTSNTYRERQERVLDEFRRAGAGH